MTHPYIGLSATRPANPNGVPELRGTIVYIGVAGASDDMDTAATLLFDDGEHYSYRLREIVVDPIEAKRRLTGAPAPVVEMGKAARDMAEVAAFLDQHDLRWGTVEFSRDYTTTISLTWEEMRRALVGSTATVEAYYGTTFKWSVTLGEIKITTHTAHPDQTPGEHVVPALPVEEPVAPVSADECPF